MAKKKKTTPNKNAKNTVENTADNSRTRGLKPAWEKGQSGNPNGRPKGTRNFNTIFREAMTEIAEHDGQTREELENQLVASAIKEAKDGNFHFWKDLHDRVHGKPSQDINLGGQDDNPVKWEEVEKQKTKMRNWFKKWEDGDKKDT